MSGMQRYASLAFVLIFAVVVGGAVRGRAGVASAPANFTLATVPADVRLAAALQGEAAKAKAAGRRPYVYFWASWCGPCKALHASLGDPLMKDAFDGTYIIQMNFDDWKKKVAGTKLAVNAIPAFFELDGSGVPTGRKIDGGAWGEDIPRNMAPPLKAFFHESAK